MDFLTLIVAPALLDLLDLRDAAHTLRTAAPRTHLDVLRSALSFARLKHVSAGPLPHQPVEDHLLDLLREMTYLRSYGAVYMLAALATAVDPEGVAALAREMWKAYEEVR